jgi:hypothetical protein
MTASDLDELQRQQNAHINGYVQALVGDPAGADFKEREDAYIHSLREHATELIRLARIGLAAEQREQVARKIGGAEVFGNLMLQDKDER